MSMLEGLSFHRPEIDAKLRYERKFVIAHMSRQQVERRLRLHPAGFREIYSPRFVNNVYFDTPSLQNYRDSVEGVTHRRKVRIRWYGDLFGEVTNPRLEVKEKVGLLGMKHVAPLVDFEVQPGLTEREVCHWLKATDLPADMAVFTRWMQPVLLNRYGRRYWISRDGRYRATLDWEVIYHRMLGAQYWYVQPQRDEGKLILELKYQKEMDENVTSVSRHFPCRLSKSSKYVTGVNLLHNFLSDINTD